MHKVDKVFSASFDEFVENMFHKEAKAEVSDSNLPLHNIGDYIEIYKEKQDLQSQINILRKRTQDRIGDIKNLQKEVLELRKLEKMLTEEIAETEQTSNDKSRFLANMSHEIRTPINGVLGMTRMLQETQLTSNQHRFLKTIETSANSLLSIINDILDYSKIEAGGLQLETIDLELADIIQEVKDILSFGITEKNLGFNYTISKDIPKTLKGDPVRLRQILLNLANNAVKFTDEGEINVNVIVEKEEKKHLTLRFNVIDTGKGIPESQMESIFKSYKQADPSISRKYGGTGLGLAISKELTSKMNGQIGVISKENEGSTFWFTAKLERSDAIATTQQAKFSAVKSTPVNRKNIRILLVDDDEINQEVSKVLLKKEGFTIDIADSGRKAIKILESNPYDLVLMDVEMPEMDGYTTTKKIRDPKSGALNPDIPIIAMTAHAMSGAKEKCLFAGMDDYISKPMDIKALTRLIELKIPEGSDVHSENSNRITDGENSATIHFRNLKQLKEDVEEDFGMLVNLFLEHLPGKVNRVRHAVATNNASDLKRAAHQLKGSCASFSADRLVHICQSLENAAETSLPEIPVSLMHKLDIEVKQVETILRNQI
ncbi:response regulator [bacterium]|nr:response regulator [bacterium]